MLIFLIILIAILFVDIKVTPQGEFHTDYSAVRQTATINGIFTILIFFSHATQYVTLGGVLDEPYLNFRKYLGQLVVVCFLFFSGFGMMQSIKNKGIAYVKGIPTKRFFKVWYHFAVAIVLYIIVNLIFDREYGIKNTLLSFTGYKSCGNSNWYMFITFVMYFIIFIAFMLCRKSKAISVMLVLAMTFAFAYFEYKIGLEDRYYNTIFCLPAGMIFSLIKPYFDKFVMKNDIFWACSFAVIFAVYYYFERNRSDSIVFYNLFSILAVILIMMITMKVKVGNTILDFFGKHVFSIFILQRLPMIALSELGFAKHKYAFIIVSFICTICIALIFDYLMSKTDKLIYKK